MMMTICSINLHLLIVALALVTLNALPLNYDIKRRTSSCVFDTLIMDEDVTVEVLVRRGPQLKARIVMEGPFSYGEEPSSELLKLFKSHDRKRGNVPVVMDQDIDFEEGTEYLKKGQPFVHTFRVKTPGVYRLCVDNKFVTSGITATMDIRKSSELGKIDVYSGQVPTHEARAVLESMVFGNDESNLEADSMKQEAFHNLHVLLNSVRVELAKAKEKQNNYMVRLDINKAINEHTYSKMVMRSLMETFVFMIVTGIQLYLIRKWFKNAGRIGMLGSPPPGTKLHPNRSFY